MNSTTCRDLGLHLTEFIVHRRGGGRGSYLGERYVTVGGGYGLALRSVTKGWVGVKFMVKKRYVVMKYPAMRYMVATLASARVQCSTRGSN